MCDRGDQGIVTVRYMQLLVMQQLIKLFLVVTHIHHCANLLVVETVKRKLIGAELEYSAEIVVAKILLSHVCLTSRSVTHVGSLRTILSYTSPIV